MGPALSYDALRQVIIEQQEEVTHIRQQQWVERSALQEALPMLDKTWVKVIIGVRRCGKSVFCHQLLREREYGYINFDDERFIGISSADFNKVLQFLLECCPGVKIFLFDEVQNVEGWEIFINRLQRQGYNLVITGSNSKLLAKELVTRLTGRYIPIELSPFSFREFLRAKAFQWTPISLKKTKERAVLYTHLQDYLYHGGFPDIVIQGYYASYLRELYDKIVGRDIVSRYQVRFIQSLKELAIYCQANLGVGITFQKTKHIFGMNSLHTVKKHFQYLIDAYLVFLLDPFTFEYKELVKQPRKIYTVDNGLSAAVNPKFSENKEAILENVIFQELRRRGNSFSYGGTVAKGVAFVLHTQKKVDSLLQVSWTLHDPIIRKQVSKVLLKAAKCLKCNDLSIITLEEEGLEELDGQTIKIIPIWKWLLGL